MRAAVAYLLMIVAAVALFLVIRDYGNTLTAPPPIVAAAHSATPAGAAANSLFHLLLALAAVVIVGHGLGRAMAWLGQPPVIGEVLAGILLGPSLLRRIAPDVAAFVLPVSAAPFLNIVAQLGILYFQVFRQDRLKSQELLNLRGLEKHLTQGRSAELLIERRIDQVGRMAAQVLDHQAVTRIRRRQAQ